MEKTLQEKRPLDRTVLTRNRRKKLLAKGQKFVPLPHKVDGVSKYKDFMAFARKLRLALYFSRIREHLTQINAMGKTQYIPSTTWPK